MGIKINLLQKDTIELSRLCQAILFMELTRAGYNPNMKVLAILLGPTVIITRYKDADGALSLVQCLLDRPNDTLILHQDGLNSVSVRIYLWS